MYVFEPNCCGQLKSVSLTVMLMCSLVKCSIFILVTCHILKDIYHLNAAFDINFLWIYSILSNRSVAPFRIRFIVRVAGWGRLYLNRTQYHDILVYRCKEDRVGTINKMSTTIYLSFNIQSWMSFPVWNHQDLICVEYAYTNQHFIPIKSCCRGIKTTTLSKPNKKSAHPRTWTRSDRTGLSLGQERLVRIDGIDESGIRCRVFAVHFCCEYIAFIS